MPTLGEWGGVALRAVELSECYLRGCILGGTSSRRRCGEGVLVEDDAEVHMSMYNFPYMYTYCGGVL